MQRSSYSARPYIVGSDPCGPRQAAPGRGPLALLARQPRPLARACPGLPYRRSGVGLSGAEGLPAGRAVCWPSVGSIVGMRAPPSGSDCQSPTLASWGRDKGGGVPAGGRVHRQVRHVRITTAYKRAARGMRGVSPLGCGGRYTFFAWPRRFAVLLSMLSQSWPAVDAWAGRGLRSRLTLRKRTSSTRAARSADSDLDSDFPLHSFQLSRLTVRFGAGRDRSAGCQFGRLAGCVTACTTICALNKGVSRYLTQPRNAHP